MLLPRTSTAPTIGFGLVLPAPLSARRKARRMYRLSRSSSIRLKKARPRVSQHRLGGALTAGGVSQDRCNSSLGERALGCGRCPVLAPLGISDCRSHISDLRFEICHL